MKSRIIWGFYLENQKQKNKYHMYVGETETVSPFLRVKTVFDSNTLQTEGGVQDVRYQAGISKKG